MVLRMHQPLSLQSLAYLNGTFADVLVKGSFEQSDRPLEGENGAAPDKMRLVFAFNRRSAGRLRMLINYLNETE